MKIILLPAYFGKDYTYDVLPTMKRVADCGFEGVQLSVNEEFLEKGKSWWREIRDCARDLGLTVTFGGGLPLKFDISSEDASVRAAGVRYLSDCLEAVSYIGAKGLDGIHYQGWNDFRGVIDKPSRWKNSVGSVKEIMKACREYNVDFALEVANRHEVFLVNTAAEAVRFCDEVGDEHVRIQLDTYHMNIEEDSMYDAIILAGQRLYNLHVCENNRKIARGKGFLPWNDIARALKEIHYDGYVTMEAFCLTGGEIQYGSKIWRTLTEDPSEEGLNRDVMEGRKWLEKLLQI